MGSIILPANYLNSRQLGNFYDNNSSKNCGLPEYWINIPQEWENFCRMYAKKTHEKINLFKKLDMWWLIAATLAVKSPSDT